MGGWGSSLQVQNGGYRLAYVLGQHTLEENPIEFAMKDKYLLAEAIEINRR